MTFPTWPMENRFHGESLTRATRRVIVAGQPIRCLVVSRVCTSVLQTGIQPAHGQRLRTLQAARHGHNGPSVPVTRTRHGDNPLDKRTYPARRTFRGGRTEARMEHELETRWGSVGSRAAGGRRNR